MADENYLNFIEHIYYEELLKGLKIKEDEVGEILEEESKKIKRILEDKISEIEERVKELKDFLDFCDKFIEISQEYKKDRNIKLIVEEAIEIVKEDKLNCQREVDMLEHHLRIYEEVLEVIQKYKSRAAFDLIVLLSKLFAKIPNNIEIKEKLLKFKLSQLPQGEFEDYLLAIKLTWYYMKIIDVCFEIIEMLSVNPNLIKKTKLDERYENLEISKDFVKLLQTLTDISGINVNINFYRLLSLLNYEKLYEYELEIKKENKITVWLILLWITSVEIFRELKKISDKNVVFVGVTKQTQPQKIEKPKPTYRKYLTLREIVEVILNILKIPENRKKYLIKDICEKIGKETMKIPPERYQEVILRVIEIVAIGKGSMRENLNEAFKKSMEKLHNF
jgi:hypothetical protein